MDTHSFAVLIGVGATTINPYLSIDSIYQRFEKKLFGKSDFEGCVVKFKKSIDAGLLKIMSKMGISVISSYRGGCNFEAVGLSRAIVSDYFPGMSSRISGIGVIGMSSMIPPMISVLVWSAAGFLVLPIRTIVKNISNGVTYPVKMIWHSEKWPLESIPGKHVWILSEVIDGTDGKRKVSVRMRPKRIKENSETIAIKIEELIQLGETQAWITKKHPFLIYVLPSIPLAVIFGDPIVWILSILGV